LLARHYLDAETSGAYGVASLFAKAILWGSQFVAQAAYPALAAAEGRHRLLVRTLAATAGLGLVGIGGTAVLGHQLVRVATGSGYGLSTGMLVAFALLGMTWSVTQVLLLAAVAVGDRRPSRLLWGLIAVEAAVVAAGPHHSPAEILTVCTVAVLLFAVLIAVLEWTARTAPPAPVPVVATDPAATPVPLPTTEPAPADRAVDRRPNRTPDRQADLATDRATDRETDRAADRPTNQAAAQEADLATDRAAEQAAGRSAAPPR
ncbi:MAG TPA: hypothetical protein VLM05_08110, partial [Mycobacteriales bacterium]|nr:hypothetical protein [Mycobacteriales bacterium]